MASARRVPAAGENSCTPFEPPTTLHLRAWSAHGLAFYNQRQRSDDGLQVTKNGRIPTSAGESETSPPPLSRLWTRKAPLALGPRAPPSVTVHRTQPAAGPRVSGCLDGKKAFCDDTEKFASTECLIPGLAFANPAHSRLPQKHPGSNSGGNQCSPPHHSNQLTHGALSWL